MLSSLFSKNQYDLDGAAFKQQFESSKNAVLIDVRTPEEFQSGTLAGAKNIDITGSAFQTTIQSLDADKEYFLFCRSGNRSGNAAKLMGNLGLKCYNLVGGIGAWPHKK